MAWPATADCLDSHIPNLPPKRTPQPHEQALAPHVLRYRENLDGGDNGSHPIWCTGLNVASATAVAVHQTQGFSSNPALAPLNYDPAPELGD